MPKQAAEPAKAKPTKRQPEKSQAAAAASSAGNTPIKSPPTKKPQGEGRQPVVPRRLNFKSPDPDSGKQISSLQKAQTVFHTFN